MKILVYDVAAESGGALTVLENVYQYAVEHSEIQWKFIVSLPKLKRRENISVEEFPYVKNGWATRYRFDRKVAPGLVSQYGADLVLNLQNILIPNVRCKQILYMQQSLPFSEYKFPLFKDPKLFVYQRIIGSLIKKSCRAADEIIVQTEWIKNEIIRQCAISEEKIKVITPEAQLDHIVPYQVDYDKGYFFYPANAMRYKNHILIVKALMQLKKEGITKKVIFTLTGTENKAISKFFRINKQNSLNIEFAGHLSQEKVYELYSKTTLVFPSYIETLGLPLVEAKSAGCPILAADLPYSHDVCKDYLKVQYFKHDNCVQLAELLKNSGISENKL